MSETLEYWKQRAEAAERRVAELQEEVEESKAVTASALTMVGGTDESTAQRTKTAIREGVHKIRDVTKRAEAAERRVAELEQDRLDAIAYAEGLDVDNHQLRAENARLKDEHICPFSKVLLPGAKCPAAETAERERDEARLIAATLIRNGPLAPLQATPI